MFFSLDFNLWLTSNASSKSSHIVKGVSGIPYFRLPYGHYGSKGIKLSSTTPKHYQFDNYASNGVCALCYSAKVQQPNGNQTNQMGKAKHGLG